MGIWNELMQMVGIAPKARFVESAVESAGASTGDTGWRRMGVSERDLSPLKQDQMQRTADTLHKSNPLSNRMIELPLTHMLSKGVALKVEDDAAQELLQAHWTDEINNWDIRLPKRVRELAMYGEQCWIPTKDSLGQVRWGAMDPKCIEQVINDPANTDQPIGIVTRLDGQKEQRKYKVWIGVPEQALSGPAQELRKGFMSGDCLYWRINDVGDQTRGVGDTLHLFDAIYDHADFLAGEVDRAPLAKAHVYDVTLTGATQEVCDARAAKMERPGVGSTRVHNESETWNVLSPTLGANETHTMTRLLRNQVLGGGTIAPTWYGDGEDANRANGESMAEPTEKVIEMRRQFVGSMLTKMARYVLRAAWNSLERQPSRKQRQILATIKCEWPPLKDKDFSKTASALQATSAALVAAKASNLISQDLAVRVLASVIELMGVQVDPVAELEAIAEEALTAADADRMPPATGELPALDSKSVPAELGHDG